MVDAELDAAMGINLDGEKGTDTKKAKKEKASKTTSTSFFTAR